MNEFYRTAGIIFRTWVAFIAAFAGALWLLPHSEMPPSLFANLSIQVFLFITALAITRHEANAKNKYVFVNFALLFGISLLGAIGSFVGVGRVLLPEYAYAKHFWSNYLYGAWGFFLAFAVVYLSIDALFREFKIATKYAIALGIVGSFFVIYFHGYLTDPKYSYTTQDVRDWKDMITVAENEVAKTGEMPGPEELAGMMEMYVYQQGQRVATLHPDARAERIAEIYPYLHADNVSVLLAKPLNHYIIYMSVLAIGFILLFFGYQYMKDPPQGAYIEKMMFLLLLLASMEILHSWSGIKAVEWESFSDILNAGQYVSVGILFFIAVFFGLRLRFIMSAKGEFYELELAQRPAGVTRWRDTLDNMVVDSFFNRKSIVGRLFVVPQERRSDNSTITR